MCTSNSFNLLLLYLRDEEKNTRYTLLNICKHVTINEICKWIYLLSMQKLCIGQSIMQLSMQKLCSRETHSRDENIKMPQQFIKVQKTIKCGQILKMLVYSQLPAHLFSSILWVSLKDFYMHCIYACIVYALVVSWCQSYKEKCMCSVVFLDMFYIVQSTMWEPPIGLAD